MSEGSPSLPGGIRLPSGLAALLGLIGVAILILGSAQALRHYWLDPRFAKTTGWTDATRYIKDRFQPSDFAILNVPDPSFGYYFRDAARSAVVPESAPVDRAATARTLSRLAADHPRIWLIPFQSPTWDAEGFVEKWLDRNARLIDRRDFHNVRARLYATDRPDLAQSLPVGADLDHGITLRSYWLEPSPGDPPGLRLVLYWHSSGPTPAAYTVFAHLVGPDGRTVSQRDNPPRQGSYPTTEWLPDEVITDEYRIDLPPAAPAGRYLVRVGFYDSRTGRRLLRQDGSDSIEVTSVELPTE